jgi:hypothetical protein
VNGATRPCRVLTRCTINGVDCTAGQTVELAEPQRGFLIAHRQVASVESAESPPPPKRKRGKDGPAI